MNKKPIGLMEMAKAKAYVESREAKRVFAEALAKDLDEEPMTDIEILKKGIIAVHELINRSHGVSDLYFNGDDVPWHKLRTGGDYEDWLKPFDDALLLVQTGQQVRTKSAMEKVHSRGYRNLIKFHLRCLPRGLGTTERDIRELASEAEPSAEWLLKLLEDGDKTLIKILNEAEQ